MKTAPEQDAPGPFSCSPPRCRGRPPVILNGAAKPDSPPLQRPQRLKDPPHTIGAPPGCRVHLMQPVREGGLRVVVAANSFARRGWPRAPRASPHSSTGLPGHGNAGAGKPAAGTAESPDSGRCRVPLGASPARIRHTPAVVHRTRPHPGPAAQSADARPDQLHRYASQSAKADFGWSLQRIHSPDKARHARPAAPHSATGVRRRPEIRAAAAPSLSGVPG